MSTLGDGGPAFPGGICATSKPFDDAHPTQAGMTLRDYFAAAALQGFAANSALPDILEKGDATFAAKDTARCAFIWADAMLAEREKKGTP